jgi:NTP pyrophosphatase (non-canonical NTP hydrolase)
MRVREIGDRRFDGIGARVRALVHACHSASSIAGWWDNTDVHGDKHVVPAKLCLIHSEISEAMEGHRKGLRDDKLPDRSMVEVELADAMIRIADLAGALNLDLGGAIEDKLRFNATRADHKLENRTAPGGKAY